MNKSMAFMVSIQTDLEWPEFRLRQGEMGFAGLNSGSIAIYHIRKHS